MSRQVAQPGFAREAGLTMALCHSRISMDEKYEKLSLLEDMAKSESASSGGDQVHLTTWAKMVRMALATKLGSPFWGALNQDPIWGSKVVGVPLFCIFIV